tara:strand:- start:1892 stop:2680 length:789 start_codon:yes stop_codon:yes gene_type:complete
MKKEDQKNNEVAVIESQSVNLVGNPQDRLKQGKDAADALMSVAQPVMIQGNPYLTIKDWQTIGSFYGLFAGADDAESVVIDGMSGFKAKAVVRSSDGTIVSSAVAYCLDEGIWKGREKFAQASMAQTRACSKALRMVVGWVAVLGGYKDTPAEEMDFQDKGVTKAHTETVTKSQDTPKTAENGLKCPKCMSGVWDNRDQDKDGNFVINAKKQPAFKCVDQECDFATWETDSLKANVMPDIFMETESPEEDQFAIQAEEALPI